MFYKMKKTGIPLVRSSRVILVIGLAVFILNLCMCNPETSEESDYQERLNDLLSGFDRTFINHLSAARQVMGKEILKYNTLADTVAIPKYMEIRGSHYEYGFLVGHIGKLFGRLPALISPGRTALNNRIIEMYQRIYPQYLDLARGIGDACGIPLTDLDFSHLEYEYFISLWYNLFNYPSFRNLGPGPSSQGIITTTHCSMISAKTDGNVFVGRNFDDSHEKPQFVVYTEMESGYRVTANACYIPYHWIMDGVNEKGLYMGTANLAQPASYYWEDPYPTEPAICEHHLFRIALETCATVDEVIDLYRSVRPWSPNGTDHLMVVDAQGNSAVIEFAMDRSVCFFRADKYYQLMTNIAYQEGMDYMKANCQRFATGIQEAEKGINGFADIERITRLIQGSEYGFTSFYDLVNRSMKLYRRNDFSTSYDFICPH